MVNIFLIFGYPNSALFRLGSVLFILGLLPACSPKTKEESTGQIKTATTMQATILKQVNLSNIPSGSGMEVIGDKIYIIGDDSPYLYILKQGSYSKSGQISLFKTNLFVTGRIPKAFKPDLECLASLDVNGEKLLLAFGSGSAPTRTSLYTVQIPTNGNTNPPQVKEYSLKTLYTALQKDKNLVSEDQLNLEAAAADSAHIYLLQRSASAGPNALLVFSTVEFLQYLSDQSRPLPAYQTYLFRLPHLQSLSSRFSGGYIFENKLFFSASVENTADAILDGEVLGSFVGWIDLNSLKSDKNQEILNTALVLDEHGVPYAGKVESLVILETGADNKLKGLAITDNDNGASDLLELEIILN